MWFIPINPCQSDCRIRRTNSVATRQGQKIRYCKFLIFHSVTKCSVVVVFHFMINIKCFLPIGNPGRRQNLYARLCWWVSWVGRKKYHHDWCCSTWYCLDAGNNGLLFVSCLSVSLFTVSLCSFVCWYTTQKNKTRCYT